MWQKITAICVGVAAILGVIAAFEPARKSWCDVIGFLCVYEFNSDAVDRKVSAGNPCDNDYRQLCIEPSTTYRRFITDSMKFVPTVRTGVHYNDGDVKKVSASETGWFLDPKKDAITEKRICISPYARTGGCEDKYSMTGHIKVLERITIW